MKKYIAGSLAVLLVLLSIFTWKYNKGKENEKALCQRLSTLSEGDITFEEVVPFSWDKLYTFAPYTSKEEIERVIGITSSKVEENMVNEGLTYLLFTSGDEVVCNFYGYPDNLGFSVDFGTYEENVVISNGDGVRFHVTKEEYGPCLDMVELSR